MPTSLRRSAFNGSSDGPDPIPGTPPGKNVENEICNVTWLKRVRPRHLKSVAGRNFSSLKALNELSFVYLTILDMSKIQISS